MLDTGCLPGGQYFGRQRRLPYWMLDFGMWNVDLSFPIIYFTFLVYLTASPFLRVPASFFSMPHAFSNLQSLNPSIPQFLNSLIPHLPECNFLHRFFHRRGEISEGERTLVLIKSKIAHDVVCVGRQLVGKTSNGIIVAAGNEKINVLKNNYDLNNEFYNLKHKKIEYGVEKPD